MKIYHKVTSVSLLVVSVYSTAYIGFYLGRLDERSSQAMRQQNLTESADRESATQPVSSQDQPRSVKLNTKIVLPADLARAKGVPEKVAHAQGDYTLVSVVEGAQLNQQLTDNLELVTAQRQQLANLAIQFDQSPANATQQKELIAGQINEVKMSLTRNLRVMDQGYSYSLNNVYLRIPHVVTLLAVSELEDGKFSKKVAHSFDSSDAYLEFQKMNDAYQRLKLDQKKLQAAENNQSGKKTQELANAGEAVPVLARDSIALSKKLISDLQAEMIKLYNYDPEPPEPPLL